HIPTPPPPIYPLSLHDALPISELVELLKERKKNPPHRRWVFVNKHGDAEGHFLRKFKAIAKRAGLNCGNCKTTIKQGKYHLRKRSEEHTSELQSRSDLVCRLLL